MNSNKDDKKEQSASPETDKPWKPRILPPYVFILSIIAIYFVGKWETGHFSINLWGAGLMALAVALAFTASGQFKKAETAIIPGQQPTTMVTGGMFRYSRNPMYTCMAAFLIGFWSWTGGIAPFAIIIAFIMVIQHRFIINEERLMLETFGEEYLRYCAHVRRWL